MAKKHTEIEIEIQIEWSRKNKGRLYRNDNGWSKKVGYYGLGKGTSDLIGFELVDGKAVFCGIEVKTKAQPYLTDEQKDFLNNVTRWGGRAYTATETDDGYEIFEWMLIT